MTEDKETPPPGATIVALPTRAPKPAAEAPQMDAESDARVAAILAHRDQAVEFYSRLEAELGAMAPEYQLQNLLRIVPSLGVAVAERNATAALLTLKVDSLAAKIDRLADILAPPPRRG